MLPLVLRMCLPLGRGTAFRPLCLWLRARLRRAALDGVPFIVPVHLLLISLLLSGLFPPLARLRLPLVPLLLR